jgi:hypothetical protein
MLRVPSAEKEDKMLAQLQRWIVQLLVIALVVAAPLAPAQAAIVGTGAAMAMSERADALARVDTALTRADVSRQLEALGVDREQAMERVAALTDAELAQLEGRLDQLPAGGNTLAVLGGVLLVLIILDIMGVTNIFTFI